MKKQDLAIRHEFVEFIPDELEEGVLYVSIPNAMAMHRCFCGCGFEVVTPFSPIEWRLSFDGESVSLYPSIGNWSFPCQSHYWVRKDTVLWSKQFSRGRIHRLRAQDQKLREKRFGSDDSAVESDPEHDESRRQGRLRHRRFKSS